MHEAIEIKPRGVIRGTIRPPGSKSITNRALVCAALARGRSTLTGALDSEDTQVMIDCLGRLGIDVQMRDAATTLIVDGCGGQIPAGDATLLVRNSGTTIRFLTAMVTLGQGVFKLDGIERMRQRPIGDLLDALNQLGGNAQSEPGNGCPPVVVRASGLRGGTATVRGDISSQYLSGLLMAAPYAGQDVTLQVQGELVSKPYVEMTLRGMESFGIQVPSGDLTTFTIPGRQTYRATEYAIEPDASAASYFWGAAAVTSGDVTVEGLTKSALQGDVRFVDCLARMGCEVSEMGGGIRVIGKPLKGIEVDMNAISDTVQTLAVVALFAEGPTTIRGVAHIRHKETDRIGDLARELRKVGATVDEFDDGLRIHPPAGGGLHGAEIDTYNDHRMAMSQSLAGLRVPGVIIRDPGCTAKTYPRFFEDLAAVGS